ncbi:hypothetical protein [Enterococcus olivae]
MKKRLELLSFTIAVVFVLFGLFSYLLLLLNHVSLLPGLRSLIVSALFVLVVLRIKVDWKHSGIWMLGLFAFLAMFLDVAGNELFNKPLEWFFNDGQHQFQIIRDMYTYGSAMNFNYQFALVNNQSSVIDTVSLVWIFLFRFIQYLLIGAGLLTLTGGVRKIWRQYRLKVEKSLPINESL